MDKKLREEETKQEEKVLGLVFESNWEKFYLILTLVVCIFTGFLKWNDANSILKNILPIISAPIGFMCVYLLGRKRNLGNLFGIVNGIINFFVNGMFENFGMQLNNIYNTATHIFGFFDWKKHEDKDGDVEMKEIDNKKDIMVLIFFFIVATAYIIFAWTTGMISPDNNPFIFYGNIAITYISMAAQGLMIARFIKISWWGWFIMNLITIPINIISHNWVFAVKYICYEINTVKVLYETYKADMEVKNNNK